MEFNCRYRKVRFNRKVRKVFRKVRKVRLNRKVRKVFRKDRKGDYKQMEFNRKD
jgi:hypothetical protein